MKSCCFILTSRQGSVLSAVCSVGAGLSLLGHMLYNLQEVKCKQLVNANLSEVCQDDISWDVLSITLEAAVPCLMLLTGGAMLVGIAKNRAGLLIPWIVLNAVFASILAIGIFWSVRSFHLNNTSISDIFTFSSSVGLVFMTIYLIYYVNSLYCEILNSKTKGSVPDANTIYCEKEKQLIFDKGDSSLEHIYIHNEPPPAYTVYRYTDPCSECSTSVPTWAEQGRIKE